VIRESENGTVIEEIKRIGGATDVSWNAASGTDTHTHHDQNWANTRHCQSDRRQSAKPEIKDNFNSPQYQTLQSLRWQAPDSHHEGQGFDSRPLCVCVRDLEAARCHWIRVSPNAAGHASTSDGR
jgi:hypothetical protein